MPSPLNPVEYEELTAWVDARVAALAFEDLAVSEAAGRVLAAPLAAEADHPAAATAAVDGFALEAAASVGAGDYNPLPFDIHAGAPARLPPSGAVPVASGQPLPAGADTVIPILDIEVRGGRLEVYAPVAPGENVIPAGREARAGEPVLDAGRVLRPADIALATELGLARVPVVRPPRVGMVLARRGVRDAGGPMVRALVARDGGNCTAPDGGSPAPRSLAEALAAGGADMWLVIGGSGPGADDHAAEAVAEAGELVFCGVAINPGETTRVGRVGDAPVVVLPGPPLGALFGYDAVAGRILRRLAGRAPGWPYAARRATLDGKIASGLGRLECARVRVSGERAAPLAVSDPRTLATAVRADGFVPVPAASEGFAEGAQVTVYLYDSLTTRGAADG